MTNVEGRRPEGAPERSRKAGEGAASGVDGKVAKRLGSDEAGNVAKGNSGKGLGETSRKRHRRIGK